MKTFVRKWKKRAAKFNIKNVLIFLLSAYPVIFASHFGGACRFVPSCSAYARKALAFYPLFSAIKLILKRLGRCHFWGPKYVLDPVIPPPSLKLSKTKQKSFS